MPSPQLTVSQALMTARLIWAAMVFGVIAIGGILFSIMTPRPSGPDQSHQLLFYVAVVVTVASIAVGYFLRHSIYQKHRTDHVAPQGFLVGNILLLAAAEGAAFLSLIIMFLAGTPSPFIAPAVIALIVMLMNFPTGSVMAKPDLQDLGLRG